MSPVRKGRLERGQITVDQAELSRQVRREPGYQTQEEGAR